MSNTPIASAAGSARSSRRNKTVTLTVTAMLTALIVVMAFTPIGYLRIGGLELTLIMVPVVIGAITCGPAASAFLGLVFGIVSFIQCFTGSPFGAIAVSISVLKTLIVNIAARVLAGWLCGLIFKAVKTKTKQWSYVIAGASGSLLNTVFFLGLLALLFWNVQFTPEQATQLGGIDTMLKTVIAIAMGINAPIELAVCTLLGSAVGAAVTAAIKRIKQ